MQVLEPIAESRAATRSCPLCEVPTKVQALPTYSRDEWEVVQCEVCNFIFLHNPPPVEALSTELAWEKTRVEETARRRRERSAFDLAVSKLFRKIKYSSKRAPRCDRLALAHFGAGVILDIGCGSGQVMKRVAQALNQRPGVTCQPLGIEVSQELAQQCNEDFAQFGGQVIHADALAGLQGLPDASADGAYLDSFLEHEVRPVEVLRELARVLAPGSHIVIKVPNFACLNRRLMTRRWCGLRYPDHVNYFTPSTLKQMTQKCGFSTKRLSFTNQMPTNDNMYSVLVRD